MPDWFTHSLVGWMTGKAIKKDVSIIIIGSLIPDLVKIQLAFVWIQSSYESFFTPIHTPIGSLLVAGIISLFFIESKHVFYLLSIGLITHFILDFFLVHVSGGMLLLFPFSWEGWQIYLIRSDNYFVTIITVIIAILFYIGLKMKSQKKTKLNT